MRKNERTDMINLEESRPVKVYAANQTKIIITAAVDTQNKSARTWRVQRDLEKKVSQLKRLLNLPNFRSQANMLDKKSRRN